MRCSACGAALSAGARWCSDCGEAVVTAGGSLARPADRTRPPSLPPGERMAETGIEGGADQILKKERLAYATAFLVDEKGDLILTATTLSFVVPPGLRRPHPAVRFAIPLRSIVNVRAKKAFAAGSDHLEIWYREGAQERKLLFKRFSFAQWANSLAPAGNLGRLEPTTLATWESAITQARERAVSAMAPGAGKAPVDLLKERLARGEITLDEFRAIRDALDS
jgi:hypothetical protein